MGLAQVLRSGTSEVHSEAEGSAFVRCFMKGVLDRATYARHLEALHAVYSAMEDGLERHKDHPIVSKIYYPEVHRRANLEADLEFFYGDDWQSKMQPPSPAVVEYVDHIRKISEENPTLLVAHSYVRYLGDLSGGQILKKVAGQTLQLDADHGLAFYEFGDIAGKKEFKDMYRNALDGLALDEAQQQAVLEEAIRVFRFNGAVFNDLEEELISNLGRDRYEAAVSS